MENPIIKPNIPYKGHIPGGLVPGRMCRIQGVSHPDADRFNINFQTGPRPMDDTALHVSVRHKQGYIARNSYVNEEWGEEMGEGDLPIGNAESWEIIILVDQQDYKIAVNGQHFTEFPHRVPISKVTDLLIDGEVSITLISWEGIMAVGGGENAKKVSHNNQEGTQWAPQGGYGAPQGGYGAPQGGYGAPQGGYGAPQGGYGPPQGGYGPPQGYGGYGPAPGYGGPQGYGPPPPPGAEPESSFDTFLDGAQSMLAGAIKSGAATSLLGKLLGSGDSNHQDNQRGYAHNNAKYGIYPDLPQDMDLNLDKGHQQSKGPIESLLSGLLYGGNQQSSTAPGNQPHAAAGGQGTQQSGPDIVSLLSGLLSSNNQQSSTPGGQLPSGGQIPPGSQHQGGDNLSTFLSGLLTGHNQQSGAPGSQVPPGSQMPPGSQPQGGDNLSTFLTGLLTGHNNQPGAPGSQVPPGSQMPHGGQVPPGTQPQSGENLTTFLTGLLTGQNQQPSSQNQEGSHGHGGDLLGLMSGLLSGTATRPIQETHPSGNHPTSPPPNTGGNQSQTDFGSILTHLLSGGSQQPGTAGYQGPGNVGPQGPGHQGPGTPGYQSSGTQQSQGLDLGSLLIGLLAPSDNNPQSGGVHPPYGGKTPYSGPYGGPTGGSQPHTGPTGGFQPYSGPTGGPQPPIGSSQPHSGPVGGSQPHTGPIQPQGGNTAQTGGGSQGQNTSGGGQRPISASKGAGAGFEDVSDQFEREMAQQGHRQYSAKEGEQYGYYPQPPEQHQGPIESLVSGLFGGGGGGHQQQQPQHQSHIPQFGGGPSVGGLGSMGGILNFAGNILHPKDDNQRHNY